MPRSPRLLAALLGALVLLPAVTTSAQGVAISKRRVQRDVDDDDYPEAEGPRRGTLRGTFGVPVAERLLVAPSVEERLRGVTRLGAIGTPEALEVLTNAMERNPLLSRVASTRLEAVRILARHADREAVRPLLVRELSESGAEVRGGFAELSSLSRGAAALALAKTREKKATLALVGVVLQGGPGAEAARAALMEHPPMSITELLEGRRRIEPTLTEFLAELGDVRAIPRLRKALEDSSLTHRAAAAIALARLGDATPAKLAREWIRTVDPKQRRAGAEVLARLGAEGAEGAIVTLLGSTPTRLDGLRLALLAPSSGLVKPLVSALESLVGADREQVIAAIGRAGGADAANALLAQLGKPDLATAAAFALARMPGKEGRDALERALASDSAKKGAPRRLIVRAALVRALVLGDEPSGVGDALASMAKESDVADRAVGMFGRVATGRVSVRAALAEVCPEGKKTCDTALVSAIARGALARAGEPDGEAGLSELGRVLAMSAGTDGVPSSLAIAAGVALLVDPRAKGLSTAQLAQWAEGESPLAPLSARALPSRDDEAVRGRIKRLLAGTDPVLRAHTALGLALDPEPDATMLLANAYRFEEDVTVRRAVIRALSVRREPQRATTLSLARDLDPDDGVRALARAALSGRALLPSAAVSGGNVIWISLVANTKTALSSIQGRGARVVRSDGVALPAVTDPDGVLLVPGLPDGAALLTLAPEAVPGDAAAP